MAGCVNVRVGEFGCICECMCASVSGCVCIDECCVCDYICG